MGIEQFAGQHFGTADAESGTNPCLLPTYAERGDIEQIFGRDNVRKWADMDNLGDEATIATRICWALAESYVDINSRLRGGPYSLPFVAPLDYQIISMSARDAGVKLYEGRGITDFSENGRPQHQLSAHRDQVAKWLQQLLAGTRHLNIAQTSFVPGVVNYDNDVIYDDTLCACGCGCRSGMCGHDSLTEQDFAP